MNSITIEQRAWGARTIAHMRATRSHLPLATVADIGRAAARQVMAGETVHRALLNAKELAAQARSAINDGAPCRALAIYPPAPSAPESP